MFTIFFAELKKFWRLYRVIGMSTQWRICWTQTKACKRAQTKANSLTVQEGLWIWKCANFRCFENWLATAHWYMYFVKICKQQLESFNILDVAHCAVQPFNVFILCHTAGEKNGYVCLKYLFLVCNFFCGGIAVASSVCLSLVPDLFFFFPVIFKRCCLVVLEGCTWVST